MNNPDIMEKLIECSQAGVKVELFIRGICCLLPGIPGKTENITVTSVVGRWLEHSRIYKFGEGDGARIFIGSGDLLNRNLERRVEAFAEVTTKETREQINTVLNALRADREKSRRMLPDGSYIREEGGEGTSSQEALYQYFSSFRVSSEEEEENEKESVSLSTETEEKVELVEETDIPVSREPVSAPEKPKKEETTAETEVTESRADSAPVSFYSPVSEEKNENTQKPSFFQKMKNLFFGR